MGFMDDKLRVMFDAETIHGSPDVRCGPFLAGVRAVLAVEASPRVLPHLRDTFARNGVCVDLRHGMVVPGPGQLVEFHRQQPVLRVV